jgi:hypothetical protein
MKSLLTVLAACAAACSLVAQAEPAPQRAEWHFPIHLNYLPGVSNIVDTIVEDGGSSDTFEWPLGASFQPYVMFPNGFGFGFDVGPIMLVGLQIDGDEDWDEDETSVLLPLGAYVRYDFAAQAPTSAYARAGLRQCFASGDLLRDGSIGANVGLGVEFSRDRRVSWGFEVSYDSCTVEVWQVWRGTYSEETPYGVLASAFISF